MKIWIILAIIAVAVVQGTVDQWNLLHFSKNEDEIRECLEKRTDLPKVLHDIVKFPFWEHYIIDRLSHLVHSQTIPVVATNALGREAIRILRNVTSGPSETQSEQVKEAITNAVIECSDPIDTASGSRTDCHALPRFIQEPPELANLFNFMFLPKATTVNREGETALTLIESALRRVREPRKLNIELLRMWERRATVYYDDSYSVTGYFSHFYSRQDPRPCTCEDPSVFAQRMHVNYYDRNQRELPEVTRSNIFHLPNSTRLTASRFFYERHRSGFLRSLFLHLELIEQGLAGSNYQLPQNLSAILYGDMDYFRQYFDNRQRLELSHGFAENSIEFSSLVQSLRPGDRIDEFDLLMMFWYRLRSSGDVTTTTTSTTSSNKETGKGPIIRLTSGKCRLIRPRVLDSGNSGSSDDTQAIDNRNPGPSYSADIAYSECPELERCFSYKSEKKKPLTETEKVLLEIVHSFFSQSEIQDELNCGFRLF